jgi:leader peptidase (prepilin peptidase)/N-methyltransferase
VGVEWAAHVDTAAFGALVSAAAGVLVPRIIERVPEPEADVPEGGAGDGAGDGAGAEEAGAAPRFEGGETEAEEPPKELYAAIADLPGLLWKSIAASLVIGGLVGFALGWDVALLVWLPLVPVSIALAVIDWRTRLLPTWLILRTYAGVIVLAGVAALVTQDWQDLVRAAIGWAGAGVLYFVLWYVYPRGLGYGDVRLSGILGIALGYVGTAELVVGVYAGFLLGGVGGALLSLARIVHRKHVPFGPFMLVGALAGLLFGDWLGGLTTG